MKSIKNKKKKFVVIGQFDRKNEVEAFTVDAGSHATGAKIIYSILKAPRK